MKGQYEADEPGAIELKRGFSKDHRPDLKQVVLSLIVNGPSNLPLWMESLDGNSSDKTSFHETIKKVEEFKRQLNLDHKFRWVADSALYTPDKLLKHNECIWLTRVPETITSAKLLTEMPSDEIKWQVKDNGYKISPFESEYGGIKQRWLLVHSEQAEKRERAVLEKNLLKKDEALTKELARLGNELFKCEKDAAKTLVKVVKSHKFYTISSEILPVMKYEGRGKPKADAQKIVTGYYIKASFARSAEAIDKIINSKGRFILATNNLDVTKTSDEDILFEYKEQQNVEGGFRFLKDPWFMVDSVFLKLPRRIEALMMVMTLCLMVYNVAQHRLREALKSQAETLPNQLGKATNKPTMRWIFQIMEGIGIVRFFQQNVVQPVKELLTNLNVLRRKIIFLMGENVVRMYGLKQNCENNSNSPQSLGM